MTGAAAAVERPLPVAVLTGFLGAGKTTLLNLLLADPALANTAVIINEFGEIGLDHLFVEAVDEGIVELASGCLCCTIRGELVDTLHTLVERADSGAVRRPDRVVIETTGLADPAPVLQTIMRLCEDGRFALGRIVTLVDAVNGAETLAAHREAARQVAVADAVVLSKTDLLDDGEGRDRVVAAIRALNPGAPIHDAAEGGGFGPAELLGPVGAPDRAALAAGWLDDAPPEHDHHHVHDVNRHSETIRAFTLVTDAPVSARAFQMFVDLLRSAHGPNLLRVKGIVGLAEHPDRPLVLHGVQHLFHPPVFLERWPDGDRRTRLVFITDDLPESFVSELFDAFVGKIAPDRPDRAALTDNPLAVPGVRLR
jgi:G3E family GTPase